MFISVNCVMVEERHSANNRGKNKKFGNGIFIKLIDRLPAELQFPAYQYYEPVTKLEIIHSSKASKPSGSCFETCNSPKMLVLKKKLPF